MNVLSLPPRIALPTGLLIKPPYPSYSHSRYLAQATQELSPYPLPYFQIMPNRCKKAYNDPFGTNPPYLAIHAAAQLAKVPSRQRSFSSQTAKQPLTFHRSQLPKPQPPQHIRRQHNQHPQRHNRAEHPRRKRVVGRKARDPLRGVACALEGCFHRGPEVLLPGAEEGF